MTDGERAFYAWRAEQNLRWRESPEGIRQALEYEKQQAAYQRRMSSLLAGRENQDA